MNLGKKVLQIWHSEGAVHVRNALRACPAEVRERIEVVVIAGGTYIYLRRFNEQCESFFEFSRYRSTLRLHWKADGKVSRFFGSAATGKEGFFI